MSLYLYSWTTTIKLPLKGDLQRTSSLVNKFQDIQPSLLLFLHRLKSIVIVNKVCNRRWVGKTLYVSSAPEYV